MFYNNFYFGMHFAWCVIWGIMLFWIFALPYDFPGQRRRKDTPLEILKQRYASGQLTTTEYNERKKIFEKERIKSN